MEIQRIEKLINEWEKATDKVIEFKNIDLSNLQKKFRETCNILEKYSNENLVPKEISKLLLEINDFGWWVSELDDTPLHEHYQEIVSLISTLSKYFFMNGIDINDIETDIEKIN